MNLNNSDISQILQSKGGGSYYTKATKGAYEERYKASPILYGYTMATSDIERARGQIRVQLPELNLAPILARVLYGFDQIGPNGSNGNPRMIPTNLPVVLIPLNNAGQYGAIASFNPIDANSEKDIEGLLRASGVTDTFQSQLPPSDSKMSIALSRHQFDLSSLNGIDFSAMSIMPPLADGAYSWPVQGSFTVDGYNGERFETLVNTVTKSSVNQYELIDGLNNTKSEKTKAELFSFYHHTKSRLANKTKRLFEYRNGRIIPGPLLSQIQTFSGNFGESGQEVRSIIDTIINYINVADNLIETTADFIEWFSKSPLEKVTDLIDIIGLPSSINIGGVIKLGVSYSGDPIKMGIDLNLGNKYVEAFLEGVANTLINDFIGETSLSDLISDGLSFLGIDPNGKDDPDKTQVANVDAPKIPVRKENKSLTEIIDSLGGLVPGTFGDYLKQFRSLTSEVGLVNNGTIQLDNPYSEYFSYIDYSNLNLDLEKPDGRLASYLSCYGVEYAPFIINAITNFVNTNNPIYLFLSVLPFLKLSDRIVVTLYVYYMFEAPETMNYLVQEFISPNIDDNNNKYLLKLLNLKRDDIFLFLDELEFNYFDFNNTLFNPIEELLKLDLSSLLQYYLEELLAGKILNFYRGLILISTGYDILLDVELYTNLTQLTKQVHYLYE